MNNPALKDIGQVQRLLGAGALAASHLWTRPVHDIHPTDITTFMWRMKAAGRRDEAESAVEVAMREIMQAVSRNELGTPRMLSYSRPQREIMTVGELRRGLEHVGQPKAAAILFALEMELDATGVAMLTWRKARALELTELAATASKACPRHFRCEYVFWSDDTGRPLPLFGLDHDVFEAFGLVWGELAAGYANLVWIDGDADAAALMTYLAR